MSFLTFSQLILPTFRDLLSGLFFLLTEFLLVFAASLIQKNGQHCTFAYICTPSLSCPSVSVSELLTFMGLLPLWAFISIINSIFCS